MVLRYGIIPACVLMAVSVSFAFWQYFAVLHISSGAVEQIHLLLNKVLFYVMMFYFAAIILLNFVLLISSMMRFRRQINSYFAFREHHHSYVLLVGTSFYCFYLLIMLGCILFYFGVPMMEVFSVSVTLIYAKCAFFVFAAYLVIRFHRRYYFLEPALYTLDEIDEKVENNDADAPGVATCSVNDSFSPLNAEVTDFANRKTHQSAENNDKNGQISLSEEPSVKLRLQEWAGHEKKYFLRDDINLLKVAEMIGVPPRLLSGYLNAMKGMNFNQYINALRIDEAKRLIRQYPDKTLTDIAYSTGYSSVAIFSRSFKRITGFTPTHYRQSCQEGGCFSVIACTGSCFRSLYHRTFKNRVQRYVFSPQYL